MSIKIDYSIDMIKDEARELVRKGVLARQQAIYTICQFVLRGNGIPSNLNLN